MSTPIIVSEPITGIGLKYNESIIKHSHIYDKYVYLELAKKIN